MDFSLTLNRSLTNQILQLLFWWETEVITEVTVLFITAKNIIVMLTSFSVQGLLYLLVVLEELLRTVRLLLTLPLEFCLDSKLLSRDLDFMDFFLTASGEFLLFLAWVRT